MNASEQPHTKVYSRNGGYVYVHSKGIPWSLAQLEQFEQRAIPIIMPAIAEDLAQDPVTEQQS